MQEIETRLAHIVTRWDRKQEKRKGYNRYALAQYLGRTGEVAERIANGLPIGDALKGSFNGPLAAYIEREFSK